MSRPEGHITILFTDMESSSSIAAAVGNDVYREKLREPHNRVIRQAIQEAGGYEVGTPAGDSFMAVFHRAEQALACAVAIQQVLESQPITARGADGQEYRVRVRVGVHTAENPLRLSEEQEYVGADVAFAKRVESLGVGGQILVSSSARRSCGEVGYSWRRWPNRRLRGFENTQTLFEL
ncbi:MAG TPA: adenylate/guanylate cyclase domain-containing protein, partial [Candidatus Nitrosotenuis sp.]|nr:adenylate/guanylate cyclase domain-containing protein [Candidatus Nitrosotenuis sp.]